MAQFKPFNYGQAAGQGTTNALNTMNIRNAQAQEQRAQTKFDQSQQLENSKLLFSASSELLSNPSAASRIIPDLQSKGIISPDLDWQNIPQEQLMERVREVNQGAGAALQAYSGGQSSGSQPSSIKEYDFYQNLKPEEKKVFLQIKRANPNVKMVDQGDKTVAVDPVSSEVVAEFPKNLPPASQPKNIIDIESAKLEGKDKGKKITGKTKAEMKTSSGQDKTKMLNDLITQAKDQAGFWTTGLTGQALSGIGGTPAHDLQNTLNTVKSNIGFDKLQEMRDSSPTGGALGQVSEKENILLQSTWGALEQSQSAKQFKNNLDRVNKQVKASWARIARAYEQDYGEPWEGFDAGEQEMSIEDLVNQYAQ